MRSEVGDSAFDSGLITRSNPADPAAYAYLNIIIVHEVSSSLKGTCNVSDSPERKNTRFADKISSLAKVKIMYINQWVEKP